jgi:simple sugar transport system ATP-binding protein/ribose transport system ATP-binding protein
MVAAFQQLATDAGFDIPINRAVGSLSIAQQQQVEILRALSRGARLIVMDEPSARLSAIEAEKLRLLIRRLSDDGRSVLLISHFLAEVLAVADDITVLRDGRIVSSGPAAEATEGSIIRAMLGRELGKQFPDRDLPPPEAPVLLRVDGLSGPGFVGASLAVKGGEIVGLAGLIGAGRSELGRVIVGAARRRAGSVEVAGQQVDFASPRAARRSGVVMLPESRRDQGLFYLRSVRENVSVTALDDYSRLGFVDRGREVAATDEAAKRVGVSVPGGSPVSALSGGNQQRLLFARAMLARPRVLIADEPTRGVDVGAKREIYELLAALAREGMAILLISSEMEEVLGLSHRVLAMRSGRIVAELQGDDINEAAVLNAIFESPAAAAAEAVA